MQLFDEKKEYEKFGAYVGFMDNHSVLNDVLDLINHHFYDEDKWNNVSRDLFLEEAVKCQSNLQEMNVQKRFMESEELKLNKILGEGKIYTQSICFLRPVRPLSITKQPEAGGFHRETFYSDSPDTTKEVLNVWIPIKNVNKNNSLPYVPGSHLIPDNQIITEPDLSNAATVKKFSNGHKSGFFWAPKRIISGVDLSKSKVFDFPKGLGSYASFSSMTIHGDAQNNSEKIRFVIGFALILKNKIGENKDYFASGKSYFLDPFAMKK